MDVNIRIPVFIINLKPRNERKEHIEKQFEGREEFVTQIIEPLYHEIATVSLWNTIKSERIVNVYKHKIGAIGLWGLSLPALYQETGFGLIGF